MLTKIFQGGVHRSPQTPKGVQAINMLRTLGLESWHEICLTGVKGEGLECKERQHGLGLIGTKGMLKVSKQEAPQVMLRFPARDSRDGSGIKRNQEIGRKG